MRILSKFKDFYDGLARSDRERTPVYVRETIEEFVRPWGITFGGNLARMTEFAPIGDAILAMPATRGRGSGVRNTVSSESAGCGSNLGTVRLPSRWTTSTATRPIDAS